MNQINLFRINKPIVLVGIMGSGKTSIGTRLAKKLGASFFDIDQEIEKAVGCTIEDIFKYAGEDFFRKKENEVIRAVLENPLSIISTGGGTFLDEDIRALIKEQAVSIWLKADYNSLIDRLSRGKSRPILENGNKAELLKQLIDERYPVYQLADICVNSNDGPHSSIVNEILNLLACYQK